MGFFCLIVYSYYSDESSHSCGFNGASQALMGLLLACSHGTFSVYYF